jgi:hypothetical protein
MGKKYRDESWLRKQYVEKDKTMEEIAKECMCTQATISNWCEKFNIETKDMNDPTYPPHHRFNDNDYEEVKTTVDGTTHHVKIHRLVAVAKCGIDSVNEYTHVHHKNGCPLDNRPQNLEPLTRKEHAERHAE